MTLVRWSPAVHPRDLVGMQEEMSRLIDSVFTRAPFGGDAQSGFTPVVDIEETPEAFVLKVDLPGVEQQDVKVSLMGDTLSIRGERKLDNTRKDGGLKRIERTFGAFERGFTLGSPVRGDQVKATYRNGVLEIHVPKADEARSREIEIHTS